MAAFLMRRTPAELDAFFARVQCFLPQQFRARTPGDKLHKLAGILGAARPEDIYSSLISVTRRQASYMVHPASGTSDGTLFPAQAEMSLAQWIMLCDTQNYMPDDILTKVDRASMGVSLEARVPFLDPNLYAWAWRLPMPMKIRNGRGKWALRQVLYRHVPQSLIDRPKAGFGIPMDALLRGPLRDWAAGALTIEKLNRQGVLNSNAVHDLFEQHMSGKSNHAYLLWNLLVLTNWIDAYQTKIKL